MRNLISTYRFQFHKEFNFDDFEKIIPYLQQLGIGTIYASPVFHAVPGSTHGYDGLHPQRINPEIGTPDQLRSLSKSLCSHGISWLQDIVPNHMAYDHRNEWLMDVLEKGKDSAYASFFDIGWENPLYNHRIMAPFLGGKTEEAIEKGELKIDYQGGRFVFRYFDTFYPLSPASYKTILGVNVAEPINELIKDAENHPHKWDNIRKQLSGILDTKKEFIQSLLVELNRNSSLLKKIEEQQAYHLCNWQETDSQINFRRFFTVNGLICVNIQDEKVFEEYHRFIKTMMEDGVFHGLRIDHIDGLYDPTQYLSRLRSKMGSETPILVEKILEPGESISEDWPIEGNTGYDFLSLVNNLFTWKGSEKIFTRFYRDLTKDNRTLTEQIRDKKEYILFHHMKGELDNLYQLFRSTGFVDKKHFASIRPDEMKQVIGEFLVQCPVYRYYGNCFPLNEKESAAINEILQKVRRANPELGRAVDILEYVLIAKPSEGDEEINKKISHFYQRCMQFTGPLMAKGVEDTLMYTFHRFIGHNEVGDAPESFGISIDEFHEAMVNRQEHWPLSLNGTSTHDTKRGEDVRARLNVITDLGEEWIETVLKWKALNESLKKDSAPDDNDEYFIYQNIVGAYPLDGEVETFAERMEEYLQKALREAKQHSNWALPNEEYEAAAKKFSTAILKTSHPFSKSLGSFLSKTVDHGIINSLAQVVLKFTCPGIPDVYQGCEMWDQSLVDPDNRRPVDFKKRMEGLNSFSSQTAIEDLWQDRFDGRIKLWLVHTLSRLRKHQPELFSSGEYVPLHAEGRYKEHVFCFARKLRQRFLVVVIPLHTAIICREQNTDLLQIDWADTRIELPEGSMVEWQHTLQKSTNAYKDSFAVADLFSKFPLALLRGNAVKNERGAGLLVHLSSLPSPFGIGDMGPEAKAFADFLSGSHQKYWQLLPLNPTEAGQGHSPYSSISSLAGNPLFISPESLMRDGLLDHGDLESSKIHNGEKVNYREAQKIKTPLLEKAWLRFRKGGAAHYKSEFDGFYEREKAWLDDFSIFALLKEKTGGKPWYEWETKLKMRDASALDSLKKQEEENLQKIKWWQYVFARQWHALKTYCNEKEIKLIGDLPIYVSYDSVDVWSHRHLFALDDAGNRTGLAGVPPDDFSADGQLWGMPVFNWEAHEKENFAWWVNRLRKNVELFDMVRLDHFRAFSQYWEVPAGESTAKNGSWKNGPGSKLFKVVREALGELPFVAEDLGEIDDAVYRLRDEFNLPGMKVLQFAFGGDYPRSVHIPHNYGENFIVYTGTHDNNTTRGWFTTEADEQARLALETYVGRPVSAAEINIILARMAYASVARIAILPVQDILNMDERGRMNTPSSGENNWAWRLVPGQLNGIALENLKKWTVLYNRS